MKKNSKVVYICAAHSCGKSSLLDPLEQLLHKKEFSTMRNPSPREVIPNGLFYNKVDDLTQYYITFGILSKYINANVDYVLLDRFLVDNFSYAYLSRSIGSTLLEIHIQFLKYFYSNWDITTFYLPIEFPIVPDGFRSEDEDYRKRVNQRIIDTLTTYRIPFIGLSGSIPERFEKMINKLGLEEK